MAYPRCDYSDKLKLWEIMIIIAFVVIVTLAIYAVCSQIPNKDPQQVKCENAGGLYFEGSAFSTPNCVFKPKN